MTAGRRLRRVGGPAWARRRRIAERLEACGLPSEAGERPAAPAAPGELGRRLVAAVAGLGAVPEGFAAYLGVRPDLVAGPDCAELAALPERVPAAPEDVVGEGVARELGAPLGERFAVFEAEPFDSRRFVQLHFAQGLDGRPLCVKVVRPDATAGLEDELAALQALEPPLSAAGIDFAEARTGFERALLAQVDLAAEARRLAVLAAAPPAGIAAAAPVAELSTAAVLTLSAAGAGGSAPTPLRAEPGAARHLWSRWLALLLDGPAAPTELSARDLVRLDDGRLLLLAGAWIEAPEDFRRNLAAWLLATAHGDPDQIAVRLAAELAAPAAAGAPALAARLRRATPFRDGGWGEGGDALDEELFLHLRVARDLGLAASPRLADLVPGLVHLATLARRLDPGADGLRQALEERELSQRAREMSDLLRWERLGGNLERHAMLLAALPERIDQLLTRAAAERPVQPVAPPVVVASSAPAASTIVVAGIVGLGALVLLAERLAAAGLEWIEVPAGVLTLTLGALVLRGILRRR